MAKFLMDSSALPILQKMQIAVARKMVLQNVKVITVYPSISSKHRPKPFYDHYLPALRHHNPNVDFHLKHRETEDLVHLKMEMNDGETLLHDLSNVYTSDVVRYICAKHCSEYHVPGLFSNVFPDVLPEAVWPDDEFERLEALPPPVPLWGSKNRPKQKRRSAHKSVDARSNA